MDKPAHDDSPKPTQPEAVTLLGLKGQAVAHNIGRLARRQVFAGELGPAYECGPGGSIEVTVEEETFAILRTTEPLTDDLIKQLKL